MTVVVPSATFRLAAVPDMREHYGTHMSGWKADLIDAGSARPLESTVWNLGAMVVVLNDFPARRVSRSAFAARADQIDHYQVHLPLGDRAIALKLDNANELIVPPGEPVLMDLSRPYQILQGAGRTVQAYIPREMLDEMMTCPRDMHGRVLRGVAATILTDLLKSLAQSLSRMPAAEAADVALGTMHLVAGSLAATPGVLERPPPALESTLLRQACRFIEMHLKDPDLSTAQVCVAIKVSRATLYRMFEPYGGFASHVKERRLIRIHSVISATCRPHSLARIAEEHGFRSAAQFSRAFRDHFGYRPSEAGPARPALIVATAKPSPTLFSLADWLRPLRG